MIVFQTPESKKEVFNYYMETIEWKPLTSNVKFSINKDIVLLLTNDSILKFRVSYTSKISTLDGILNLEFLDYFGNYSVISMEHIVDSLNAYAPYWSIQIYKYHQDIWEDVLSNYKIFMVDFHSICKSRIYCSWLG